MVTNYESTSTSHARTMQTEDSFSGGMMYTDAPLPQGKLRNIVNYDITDSGSALQVRPGLTTLQEYINTVALEDATDICVYASGRTFVQDYHTSDDDNYDSTVCEYAMLGHVKLTTPEIRSFDVDDYVVEIGIDTRVFVKYGSNYMSAHIGRNTFGWFDGEDEIHLYLPLLKVHTNIHGLNLNCNNSRRGVFTTHENNVYLPLYIYNATEHIVMKGLARLEFMFDKYKDDITWNIMPVQARDITATQAVNYGYNMLKSFEAYDFPSSAHAGAIVYMDGIIPYDSQGDLVTSCRAGTELTFKLAYRYPQADVDSSKKYRVRWEIQDNTTNSATSIPLQTARGSADVTPGSEISITTKQTSYKSFTLTCKIYYASDVTDAITTDNEELNTLTPLGTMTVSYTYLTAESSATTLNMPAKTYDLGTAKGMCSWQGRLVLWGVKDCETTIWVSEINDPTWFPYPNGIDVFDDAVITCAPYKNTLLVFTETCLNQLSLSDDGLSYKHSMIQQNLKLSKEDASAILTLQNMLFFKNGNYYYMLVPGKVSTNMYGELSLAPISKPLEYLFDNFAEYLQELNCGDTLWDWWCYQERDSFRACYKVYGMVDGKKKFTDIVFQYNTKTRTWTVYTYQLGQYRCIPWIQSAVEDTKFLALYDGNPDVITVDILQPNTTATHDDTRWFQGCQEGLIDTGYRDMNPMLFKKFRSCQMNITNRQSTFKIYPELFVDNEMRFNDFVSYEEDGTTFFECNDACTNHVYPEAVIPTDRKAYATDRVCIPFTARGRIPRLILHSTWAASNLRPQIQYLTWVYRPKSGRGGRDGYNPEQYITTKVNHINNSSRWGTPEGVRLGDGKYLGEREM